MNEYKSQDYKVMYYAFKPMPPILGTKLEVLALTTILSDKLIISIMSVFSCQPEWKLLGLGMGTTFFYYYLHSKHYVMQESYLIV